MADQDYGEFELAGDQREEALARAKKRISEWGLTMPEVQPLVLDCGLGQYYQTGDMEFWIANEEEAGYCGKFIFMFEGQTCPHHHHKIKHEPFFIVRGRVRMKMEGEVLHLRDGDVLPMSPGTKHSFTATGGDALVLEVSQPSLRRDNFFDDKRIGRDGVM